MISMTMNEFPKMGGYKAYRGQVGRRCIHTTRYGSQVGALALIWSCVANCTTALNGLLCVVAVVSSLWWLRCGRYVSV